MSPTAPPARVAVAISVVLAIVLAIVLSGCSGSSDGAGSGGTEASTTRAPATTASTSSSAPASTTTSTIAPTTTTTPPAFRWRATPIDDAQRARMAASWRPGCPVPLESLRYVSLTYWGFDGAVHDGELVVHADAVDALGQAFAALFDQRFPIRSMQLVDDFGGDDDRSMAADNTSAFNCRLVAGADHWSQHAYGRAVDINPVENPYLHDDVVDPPNAAAFVDRSDVRPGMLVAGGAAVGAFDAVGWGWGGTWDSPDHQHVSASGA
ncbi:MAG: Extensin family protein [Ilumatobacteraceae bacterium]|nr:Extensin family protein [Ilumatobacteraceae bacterium]